MDQKQSLFPFVRIVGQEKMKKALLLNVIDPGIGGVLIKGEKGTAKSTAVRSLSLVLPRKNVVKDCVFGCEYGDVDHMCPYCLEKISQNIELKEEASPMRVIELPLSATEDRVAGTLDLEHVLKTGEKKFEPGVLAQANGNILYVDEVNLLDDHLVDLLLDSAAMGTNYIEREGVSFSHPARFVLVGTMNPEEGDLRPQLLDRFGLSVTVKSEGDIKQKMEVVRRRLEYDRDSKKYIASCMEESNALADKIYKAKNIIDKVTIDDSVLEVVVKLTSHFGIGGHRADITMMKAAKANAAFEGRTSVTRDDISEVAELALSHRMRKRPFEDSGLDEEELEKCLKEM